MDDKRQSERRRACPARFGLGAGSPLHGGCRVNGFESLGTCLVGDVS